MMVLLVIAGLLVAADATYDGIVHARHDRWEKNVVKRHEDGLRVGYEEFTAGTGRVALLLVHGFAAGPVTWGRMAPALAAQGFTCRAILLPGFGRPMEEYAKATRRQWSAAVHDEVARLRAGHDEVWIVGHSMGGTLSTLEALDHPEEVDGLILLAPLFEVSSRRSPVLPARTWFALTERISVFTDITEMAFPVDAHDPDVRANVVRDDFVPRSIYRELFSLTDQVRNREKELRLPVFLAYAEDDLVADPEAARRYVGAATNAARNEITVQTNAGHVVTWDYGWERTVEEICTFINHRTD